MKKVYYLSEQQNDEINLYKIFRGALAYNLEKATKECEKEQQQNPQKNIKLECDYANNCWWID